MFISVFDLKRLKENIHKNQSDIERIIIHEENSKEIQIMYIAFKKNTTYPPIADKENGSITFIVIEGKLKINTYSISDKKIIESQIICPKEIYKIPRNIFRETISIAEEDSVFIEVIEGPFNPENRIIMNKN